MRPLGSRALLKEVLETVGFDGLQSFIALLRNLTIWYLYMDGHVTDYNGILPPMPSLFISMAFSYHDEHYPSGTTSQNEPFLP